MSEKQLTGKDLQKYIKDKMAELIIVAVDGHKLQANRKARSYMIDAIQGAQVIGANTVDWVLANNTIQTLTIDQLRHAITLGIQAEGQIIMRAKQGRLTFDDLRLAQSEYEQATKP